MSKKGKRQNSRHKESRVQVGNLQQKERGLKNTEAKSVKGGGGARAGVDMRQGSSSLLDKTN